MQRKQQVGECWVCVILFAQVGKVFFLRKCVTYFSASKNVSHILGGYSAHGLFADGFLFSVKELGLLTNPGQWVRVLDAAGSFMYIVL
jgi:hypothetical protein